MYYDAVCRGVKTCELRKDDSNYCVGDLLLLQEWDKEFTGREILVKITYIMRNLPEYGLQSGYAILCFNKIEINECVNMFESIDKCNNL